MSTGEAKVKKYLYILVFICRLSIIFEKVTEEGGKNFKKMALKL